MGGEKQRKRKRKIERSRKVRQEEEDESGEKGVEGYRKRKGGGSIRGGSRECCDWTGIHKK